ncbi:MAG: hypothetical protein AB1473_05610 [Thermodesulfobacteriota bacterium]
MIRPKILRKVTVLGIALAVCLMVTPAFAWEFHMEGAYWWKWYWAGQLGNQGFFGIYDRVDQGAVVGNATNINFWAGNNDLGTRADLGTTEIKTGHDASSQTMWADIDPEVRINQAVRLRGRYHLGRYGIQLESENPNSVNPGMKVAFTDGQWYLFWLTAQTPWGIVAMGKRPFAFGLGLQYDGTDNLSSDSLLLVVPYGPIRIGLAGYPFRSGQTYLGDIRDRSGVRAPEVAGFITYTAGNIDLGTFQDYTFIHGGVERAATLAVRQATLTFDRADHHASYYVKFNNGVFFLNAEASHYLRIDKFQQAMNTSPGGPAAIGGGLVGVATRPTYIEDWKAVGIVGAVAGPLKVSGMLYWSGGLDRRAGALNDTQGWLPAAIPPHGAAGTAIIRPVLCNSVLIRPYSWLLANQYGGGNDGYSAAFSREGSLHDAIAYASRVDYAVAANLNTWASFLWADRVSKSYPWGFISPTVGGNVVYSYFPAGAAALGLGAVPSIPDSNLGWEVDAGIDWRLLEGFRFEALIGYWQPGKWFSYACKDIGVTAWDVPGSLDGDNNWGTRPDRVIDPVIGGYMAFVGEF